jgi:hypothetical protein
MCAVSAWNTFAPAMTVKSLCRGVRLKAAVAALALVSLVVSPANATDLTGTWQGTVSRDGQATRFRVAFSDDGYPIFYYTDNKGVARAVELSGPGQIQYVPPGGGVQTVRVESIVKRADGVSYLLNLGFERARNGYLTQDFSSERHNYALADEGLQVRVVRQAARYLGDRGGSTGGPQRAEIYEGILQTSD